jgi:hypothetical protein
MPIITTLLIAGSALTAVLGAAGVAVTADTNREATEYARDARRVFDSARGALEDERVRTQKALVSLGRKKARIAKDQFQRFTEVMLIFEKSVERGELPAEIRAAVDTIADSERTSIAHTSNLGAQALSGALATGTSGVFVGMATYGTAALIGTASTGTKIAGLVGVTAKNATLAYIGGGSLAAGGLGMAGGVAILGGLAAGPALMVGSIVAYSKAEANKDGARSAYYRAKIAAEEMRNAETALRGIRSVAGSYSRVAGSMGNRLKELITEADCVIQEKGAVYDAYADEDKQTIYEMAQMTKAINALFAVPMLDENGALTPEIGSAIKTARKSLELSAVEGGA